jgi:hypothetical protein
VKTVEETERHGSASSDLNQPVDASTSSEALGNYFWWHSIRLDDGRVTPGRDPAPGMGASRSKQRAAVLAVSSRWIMPLGKT